MDMTLTPDMWSALPERVLLALLVFQLLTKALDMLNKGSGTNGGTGRHRAP